MISRPQSPAPDCHPHISVLPAEVIAALSLQDGDTAIDGTFGAGGYSLAMLRAARCRVFGIDRDPAAIAAGRALPQAQSGELTVLEGCFGAMDEIVALAGIAAGTVSAVALDIGVSSMQIDQAERGFSFAKDGPLDMRMAMSGPSAADIVNNADEADLADIIWRYGEDRHSRRIARAIVAARDSEAFTRTGRLADVVRGAQRRGKDGIDLATRTFQALRIYVNDELGELERGLDAAERLLAPGGRLAVVTFHSLEDRIVKNFFKTRSGDVPAPSRHIPVAAPEYAPSFRQISRKAITAGETETAANPRARSAKLRWAIRTDSPAWSEPEGLS